MNEKYLETLEYPKIVQRLAEYTCFSAGRDLALGLRPVTGLDEVRRRIQETTEAKSLLSVRTDLSVGGARDVRPLMIPASREAMLQPADILDVRNTLRSARHLGRALTRMSDTHPLLASKAEGLEPLPDLIAEIGRCLDDDGQVLDSASPELARIRRESSIARDRLLSRLRQMISSSDHGRYLQEPIITQRNGRYVIPLRAEFKGRIPGIIHDQSASGATLFIEPLQTVELENHWRELQLAERREIERILTNLTRLIGRSAEVITADVEILAELDLALAKGRYSFALKAVPAALYEGEWPIAQPEAELEPHQHPLNLVKARHPLLNPETVVPIDVYLGGNDTVLLVTGPNTGGKTVSLKTVGLLAAMSQAGMHIPALDGSRLPVFSGIYADIGDEQSIEQSLSTFSSHMTHIIDVLAHADDRSLVLLDELGAGTDPVEGSVLAQALVGTLIERACLTMCSTHYSQLKAFAFGTPYVQNASVQFDLETLAPTFHLTIGMPGRSNAIAIAGRLGLEPAIIQKARDLLSPEDLETDALLANVKSANEAAEEARQDAEELRVRSQRLEAELQEKLVRIEQARRQVLEEARREGREELDRLREEIRRLRRSILPGAARPEVAHQVSKAVDQLEKRLAPIKPSTTRVSAPSDSLEVGDTVHIASLDQSGKLLSVGGQEAEVGIGGFRLRTSVDDLEFRSKPAKPEPTEERTIGRPQVSSPGVELDMRGWRAEEVAPSLDKYLDNAYLAGLPWVNLIHGKGTGVLKRVVREFVSGHPLVASHRAGDLGQGGDGVTIVQLRKQE